MATSIVPKSYSNVIYLQPSFSFTQDVFSSLRHLPYVKLALDFPWREVFAPIEQEYLKARFERYYKKGQICPDHFQTDLFPDLPQDDYVKPKKSSKGRKGIDF
ncbi:hypothetical protein RZN22_19265, partial [Bacillaceae bacterium S4-13-58]